MTRGTPETGPRKRCPFCRTDTGALMDDHPRQRLYECRTCLAVNVITKGDSIWWYHGWEHPDGRRVNADGKASIRPAHMTFGWWDRYTPTPEPRQ